MFEAGASLAKPRRTPHLLQIKLSLVIFMKSYKTIIFIIIIFFIFTSQVVFVDAANLGNWQENLTKTADDKGAGYKTAEVRGPESMISAVISIALAFVGVIFLVLMIYGGYLWMTAAGSEEQVTKAKKLITAAIIGLIIVIMSYAISYFVVNILGGRGLEETTS